MNKTVEKKTHFDVSYFKRTVKKYLFILICITIITGCISYIGCDYFMSGSYQVSNLLVVKPKGNTELKLRDYYNEEAVSRGLSLMNSDVLLQRIKEMYGVDAVKGSLTATQIGSTNLIRITVKARKAADAYLMLESINKTYPLLHDYFENGFLMSSANALSTDDILFSESPSLRYALLAAVLIMLLGICLIAIFCSMTDRIYNEEQAKVLLDGDISGSLPYIHKKKNKAILITYEDVAGMYVEDLDKTTSSILNRMIHYKYKAIMVTSICENEGKSTVAVNLALNLARRKYKVALLDLDLRRPAVAKILDYKEPELMNLSSLLAGKKELSAGCVRDESKWDVDIWYQGVAVKNSDILLENSWLGLMIDALKKQYDFIIIDTPPVGFVRDAEIIAGYVDAFSIVVRQDYTRAAFINDAIDQLENSGAKFCGTVLNYMRNGNGKPGKKRYGYGYGYRRYGYKNYGYGTKKKYSIK